MFGLLFFSVFARWINLIVRTFAVLLSIRNDQISNNKFIKILFPRQEPTDKA